MSDPYLRSMLRVYGGEVDESELRAQIDRLSLEKEWALAGRASLA